MHSCSILIEEEGAASIEHGEAVFFPSHLSQGSQRRLLARILARMRRILLKA